MRVHLFVKMVCVLIQLSSPPYVPRAHLTHLEIIAPIIFDKGQSL
jgi:hypothetical protein